MIHSSQGMASLSARTNQPQFSGRFWKRDQADKTASVKPDLTEDEMKALQQHAEDLVHEGHQHGDEIDLTRMQRAKQKASEKCSVAAHNSSAWVKNRSRKAQVAMAVGTVSTLLGGAAGVGAYAFNEFEVKPKVERIEAFEEAGVYETIFDSDCDVENTDEACAPLAVFFKTPGVSQEIILERAPTNVRLSGPNRIQEFNGEEISSFSFGSGVIMQGHDGAYYVLTNNHVVDDNSIRPAGEVPAMTVQMYNSRDRVEAELVQRDTAEGEEVQFVNAISPDLALLRITDPAFVPPASISADLIRDLDAEPLEIGEPVFLMGNQSGYLDSATTGIVSSPRARRLSDIRKDLAEQYGIGGTIFVQTDAVCQGGGSGGALYDAQGRLIGIHTWHLGEDTALCFSVRGDEISDFLDGTPVDPTPEEG